ncbi:MAG: glycosyltransferase [Bacteroidetes bacterium]|nr:glycosyltransferase [Bacteroidota bacterium]
MIDLSIIIVNYNVKEFLQNLLQSIEKAASGLSTEIIIVDNDSDDGSKEMLHKNYPLLNLIENKKNVGFGAANNQALKIAKGKFILLLNPDTIVKEDTFTEMISFFENTPEAGMAGCKVLNSDGTLQLACRRGFPGPWTSFTKVTGLSKLFPKSKLFARYNLTFLDENKTYEVDAISGSFMMFRRDVYEKIGGFDPDFFMYGEDLDLCYRTQKEGFKVFYVHSTEIFHYKGESTKRSKIDETKIFYDAMHLFVKKHFSASFVVEFILQFAIILRKFLAFINVYKYVIISSAFDFILFSLSILLAENFYESENWNGFHSDVKPLIYFIPAFIQFLISLMAGSYKKNTVSIMWSLVSLFFGFIFISSLTFFFKQFAFSRAVVLITYFIAAAFYIIWRLVFKILFRIGLTHEKNHHRTLIVGTSDYAVNLSQKIKSGVNEINQIIGLVAKSRKEIGEVKNNFKVIGNIDSIKKIIENEKIHKIIFSSEDISFNEMFGVVSECQGTNVEFKVAGKGMDFLVGKSSVTMLEDIPLVNVEYNISMREHKIVKSLADLSISLLTLLIVYFPVLFVNKIFKVNNDFTSFILSIPKVLIGKKSLVGPRTNSYFSNLYLGKPGLTGFWFIEKIDFYDNKENNKLDIYYAKNQNVWLDLEILGKSLSKMFFNKE